MEWWGEHRLGEVWHVQIYRPPEATTYWYRLRRGDEQTDWMQLVRLCQLLAESGIDVAQLVDIMDRPAAGGRTTAARLRQAPDAVAGSTT